MSMTTSDKKAASLYVLICLSFSVVALADTLRVNQRYQEKNQWCWAASCQAVLEFYGISETQTNIAIYGAGGNNVWNYLWGSGDPGDGIFRRGCDLIINHFGGVSGSGFTGVLTAGQLQAEIDALRPAIINWSWDSGGGHILLARGMIGNNVYLMDPWYGPSVNDYDWVVSGGGHTWQWTFQISTESLAAHDVPRWWLGVHSLTNHWDWDNNALGDQDGDNISTWEEYIADTVPTSSASRFTVSISNPAIIVTNTHVSWLGSTNRLYTLEKTSNLLSSSSWRSVPAVTDVPGTGGFMVYTNGISSVPEFFRTKVSIQP